MKKKIVVKEYKPMPKHVVFAEKYKNYVKIKKK